MNYPHLVFRCLHHPIIERIMIFAKVPSSAISIDIFMSSPDQYVNPGWSKLWWKSPSHSDVAIWLLSHGTPPMKNSRLGLTFHTSRRCVSHRCSKALRCQAPKMRSLEKRAMDVLFSWWYHEISVDNRHKFIYIYIYIHNVEIDIDIDIDTDIDTDIDIDIDSILTGSWSWV